MDTLYRYILTIISATLVCTVVLAFLDKKNPLYNVIKFLIGVFLTVTLITPLQNHNLIDFSNFLPLSNHDANMYVQSGKEYSDKEKETFITEQVRAYILDRAKELNTEISVDMELKQDLSGPEVIYIAGNVSPYKKEKLQNMIERDFGVTKENQIWR